MRPLALLVLFLTSLACSCSPSKHVSLASPPAGLVTEVPSPTNTPLPTRTSVPSPTLVALPTLAPQTPEPTVFVPLVGWSSSGATSLRNARRGATVQIGVTVIRGSDTPAVALIDVEVYNSDGNKVFQRYFDDVSFATSSERSFTMPWLVPADSQTGPYKVRIGVFSPGWGTVYDWNSDVATFVVN